MFGKQKVSEKSARHQPLPQMMEEGTSPLTAEPNSRLAKVAYFVDLFRTIFVILFLQLFSVYLFIKFTSVSHTGTAHRVLLFIGGMAFSIFSFYIIVGEFLFPFPPYPIQSWREMQVVCCRWCCDPAVLQQPRRKSVVGTWGALSVIYILFNIIVALGGLDAHFSEDVLTRTENNQDYIRVLMNIFCLWVIFLFLLVWSLVKTLYKHGYLNPLHCCSALWNCCCKSCRAFGYLKERLEERKNRIICVLVMLVIVILCGLIFYVASRDDDSSEDIKGSFSAKELKQNTLLAVPLLKSEFYLYEKSSFKWTSIFGVPELMHFLAKESMFTFGALARLVTKTNCRGGHTKVELQAGKVVFPSGTDKVIVEVFNQKDSVMFETYAHEMKTSLMTPYSSVRSIIEKRLTVMKGMALPLEYIRVGSNQSVTEVRLKSNALKKDGNGQLSFDVHHCHYFGYCRLLIDFETEQYVFPPANAVTKGKEVSARRLTALGSPNVSSAPPSSSKQTGTVAVAPSTATAAASKKNNHTSKPTLAPATETKQPSPRNKTRTKKPQVASDLSKKPSVKDDQPKSSTQVPLKGIVFLNFPGVTKKLFMQRLPKTLNWLRQKAKASSHLERELAASSGKDKIKIFRNMTKDFSSAAKAYWQEFWEFHSDASGPMKEVGQIPSEVYFPSSLFSSDLVKKVQQSGGYASYSPGACIFPSGFEQEQQDTSNIFGWQYHSFQDFNTAPYCHPRYGVDPWSGTLIHGPDNNVVHQCLGSKKHLHGRIFDRLFQLERQLQVGEHAKAVVQAATFLDFLVPNGRACKKLDADFVQFLEQLDSIDFFSNSALVLWSEFSRRVPGETESTNRRAQNILIGNPSKTQFGLVSLPRPFITNGQLVKVTKEKSGLVQKSSYANLNSKTFAKLFSMLVE